jgi:hypothetical protein
MGERPRPGSVFVEKECRHEIAHFPPVHEA